MSIVTFGVDFGFLISIISFWRPEAEFHVPIIVFLLQQTCTVFSWYWHIHNQYATPTHGETLFFAIYETVISSLLAIVVIIVAADDMTKTSPSANATTAEQGNDDSGTERIV